MRNLRGREVRADSKDNLRPVDGCAAASEERLAEDAEVALEIVAAQRGHERDERKEREESS